MINIIVKIFKNILLFHETLVYKSLHSPFSRVISPGLMTIVFDLVFLLDFINWVNNEINVPTYLWKMSGECR